MTKRLSPKMRDALALAAVRMADRYAISTENYAHAMQRGDEPAVSLHVRAYLRRRKALSRLVRALALD